MPPPKAIYRNKRPPLSPACHPEHSLFKRGVMVYNDRDSRHDEGIMELIEPAQLGRFIAALVFVLALMLGLSAVMKRVNGGTAMMPGRKRRLQVVEILPLDGRRRAVILRRDSREHLVILGANGETVVESGIESPQDESTKDIQNV